jgi:hypothetical protein
MPRRKLGGVSSASAKSTPATGFTAFEGPAGAYRGKLKQLTLSKNKNNDDMLRFVWECDEATGSNKAQYNGQSIWNNQNVTDDSSRFVNGFLVALGASDSDIQDFWANGPMVSATKTSRGDDKITKIGSLKVDEAGMALVVSINMGKPYTNPQTGVTTDAKMEIKSFLVPPTEDHAAPEDEEDEAEEGIESPAEESDEDEADEVEEEAEEADEVEEEAESEVDPAYTARAEELDALAEGGKRPELVKIAKSLELKPLKRHSDDDIIDMILTTEFPNVTPEDADEEEAEEDAAPAPAPEPAAAPPARRARGARTAGGAPPF